MLPAEFADAAARDADDLALDLLAECGNDVGVTVGEHADDVRAVLAHASGVVASDGQALDPRDRAGADASRGCWTTYTGGDGLTLTEAVRKATSAPAGRMGLREGKHTGTGSGTVVLGRRRQ